MLEDFKMATIFSEYLDERQLRYINQIREEVILTLNNKILRHFTDHSVNHSDRMVNILEDILEENMMTNNDYTLSRDELYILLLSIYLHDISMQVPKAHGIDKDINEFEIDDYQIIRKNHGEVSSEILLDTIEHGEDLYNLHLNLNKKGLKKYMPFVSELVKNHQSIMEYAVNRTLKFEGKNIRIGVLISILRLVDQLDCDHNRVDIDKLDQYSISEESIVHWIICDFVTSVSVKNGLWDKINFYPSIVNCAIVRHKNYWSQFFQVFSGGSSNRTCVYLLKNHSQIDSFGNILPNILVYRL